MNSSDVVFKLFSYAIEEIRDRAEVSGDRVSFHLADLIHDVPEQLAQLARGELTYADVLKQLKAKAELKKCGRWIENIQKHLEYKEAQMSGNESMHPSAADSNMPSVGAEDGGPTEI